MTVPPGFNSGAARTNKELSEKVQSAMRTRIADSPMLDKIKQAVIAMQGAHNAVKRRRIAALCLTDATDLGIWETIHNDKEHYEVIEQKINTTVKGDAICIIQYYEIGDDVPITSSRAEE